MPRPSKVVVLAGTAADRDLLERSSFVLKTRGFRVFTVVTKQELGAVLVQEAVAIVVSFKAGAAAQTKSISPDTRVMEMGSWANTVADVSCPYAPFGSDWIELLTTLVQRKRGPKRSEVTAPMRRLA